MEKEYKNNKPTVAILATPFVYANMESVINSMAKELGSTYSLLLVTDEEKLNKEMDKSIDIYDVKEVNVDYLAVLYSFFSAVRTAYYKDVDIFMNVGKTMPLGVSVSIVCALTSISSVVRVTESYLQEYMIHSNFITKIRKFLMNNIFLDNVLKMSDKRIPVGKNLASDMVEYGHRESRVHPTPNPFNNEIYYSADGPIQQTIKKRLGLNPNKYTLLFVGNLIKTKGVCELVRIARKVDSVSERYEFCVVGSGKLQDWLVSKSPPNMSVHGYVDRSSIKHYYACSDLFVYPTKNDALPNVILESIASELPVVSKPVGEINNYVRSTFESNSNIVSYILEESWQKEEKPFWFGTNWVAKRYSSILSSLL